MLINAPYFIALPVATVSTPHLMNGVSGTKAQLNPRTLVHKSSPGDPLLIIRPPSPKVCFKQQVEIQIHH